MGIFVDSVLSYKYEVLIGIFYVYALCDIIVI